MGIAALGKAILLGVAATCDETTEAFWMLRSEIHMRVAIATLQSTSCRWEYPDGHFAFGKGANILSRCSCQHPKHTQRCRLVRLGLQHIQLRLWL